MGLGPPIARSVARVQQAIALAASRSGRSSADVCLLAVSKTRSAEEVAAAADAGIGHFGENYLQEALPKVRSHIGRDITWHFIGTVQSNKTRDIARNFQWVHTLDRNRIAERLNSSRAGLAPLDVCIEVNIDDEPQKSGIAPDAIGDLIDAVRGLEHLRLRGLMVIPAPKSETHSMRDSFSLTADLFHRHRPLGGPHWDTLSMGMSDDFSQAIEEGATCVRIGTAIFGPRH
ncbi:MAG: YggS family pyridoxal phosphate-dependent enzyme [Gammaproteobacteria bacterium]|nr:YggS family pyridoxal phosphate-dependent enzyme [Gammaproteobacteria bacterium]